MLPPVKLQGKCGSCYAHSVIEMIEANLAIHKNLTKALSVQQMIDCSEGNDGCDGGDVCILLDWLVKSQIKIHTERDYPRSEDGMNQTCHVFLNDSATEIYHIIDFTCNR